MPNKPIGDRPMSAAERNAKWRERNRSVEQRLEASRLETIDGLRARLEVTEALLVRALDVIRSALKK